MSHRCESCGRFMAREYAEWHDVPLCPKCDALIGFLYENGFWKAVDDVRLRLYAGPTRRK